MLAGFKIKSEVKKNAIFQLVSILSAPKMDVLFHSGGTPGSSKAKTVAGAALGAGTASGPCKQELNDQNSSANA